MTPAAVFLPGRILDPAAGAAWTVTAGVGFATRNLHITPYVAVAQYDSTEIDRVEFVSFGLSLALRYTSDELTDMLQPPPPQAAPWAPP